jgi:hypothetical protein
MVVSTVSAYLGIPLFGPYDMRKRSLEAMSDVVRLELRILG